MVESPPADDHQGSSHHPNSIINFLYYFYIPLAVVYMPFGIWEHGRHYFGWIVLGWWPLVVAVLSLLAWFGFRAAKKRAQLSASVPLWPLLVVFVVGIAVWGWNCWSDRQTPELTWTRLGLEVLDQATSKDHRRYEQARIIVDGTIPTNVLLTPHDQESLNEKRRASGFLTEDGLSGANFAVFESNEIWKCPSTVTLADGKLNALMGVYVVRDDQVPHVRLTAIGKNVDLAGFPPHGSKYRLLVVLFPIDEKTSKQILERNFQPANFLEMSWTIATQVPHAKGH